MSALHDPSERLNGLGQLWMPTRPRLCTHLRPRLVTLPLECMGDHKMVEFWSNGQLANFQTFVGVTPFIRCLS